MRKSIRYIVRLKGEHSSFSDTGYSKFHARWSLMDKGKLRGPVYGLKQAREHIAELRTHVWREKKIYADRTFEIVREITITKTVAVLKP